MPGGGNEHFNDETGKVWLERVISKWPSCLWINPNPEEYWGSYHSTEIIKEIFNQGYGSFNYQGNQRRNK